MTYLWGNLGLKKPRKQPSFISLGFALLQSIKNEILVKDTNDLYSSSLIFVRNYYILDNIGIPCFRLSDQSNAKINPLMLATPEYMPNLELLVADISFCDSLDVEASLISTTYYTQRLSIALKTDYHCLDKLSSSLAKPAIALITSLSLITHPPSTLATTVLESIPSDLTPELRSIDIIKQILNLSELSVDGIFGTPKYIDQIVKYKPTLKILDLVRFFMAHPNQLHQHWPKCDTGPLRIPSVYIHNS